ncbi:hypothetical protein [Botrimarina hoheduenensis]|uniref:Uncharacterized protein n=1 Tax=Botrimarina hoheduenensis TaxID=2528000 RepID=A0A5C5W7W9_9BACT|nr:hypothetical protein [Botrimarina hoheduenensis]TWT46810.1 hypothetical protein Pla111_19120 [Botrimarina hoheduenensis]
MRSFSALGLILLVLSVAVGGVASRPAFAIDAENEGRAVVDDLVELRERTLDQQSPLRASPDEFRAQIQAAQRRHAEGHAQAFVPGRQEDVANDANPSDAWHSQGGYNKPSVMPDATAQTYQPPTQSPQYQSPQYFAAPPNPTAYAHYPWHPFGQNFAGWPPQGPGHAPQAASMTADRRLMDTAFELERMAHQLEVGGLVEASDLLRRTAMEVRRRSRLPNPAGPSAGLQPVRQQDEDSRRRPAGRGAAVYGGPTDRQSMPATPRESPSPRD